MWHRVQVGHLPRPCTWESNTWVTSVFVSAVFSWLRLRSLVACVMVLNPADVLHVWELLATKLIDPDSLWLTFVHDITHEILFLKIMYTLYQLIRVFFLTCIHYNLFRVLTLLQHLTWSFSIYQAPMLSLRANTPACCACIHQEGKWNTDFHCMPVSATSHTRPCVHVLDTGHSRDCCISLLSILGLCISWCRMLCDFEISSYYSLRTSEFL